MEQERFLGYETALQEEFSSILLHVSQDQKGPSGADLRADLNCRLPIVAISTPSIRILPCMRLESTALNKQVTKVDLPDPVRPQSASC